VNLFQINLFVDDFQPMLRFYRDQLGFEVNDIEPGPPCEPLVNWASLRTGDVMLELFDVGTFGDREALKESKREAIELAFIVDDVDESRQRLEDAGVPCTAVIDEPWGRYAALRDLEGNRLQIFEVFDSPA